MQDTLPDKQETSEELVASTEAMADSLPVMQDASPDISVDMPSPRQIYLAKRAVGKENGRFILTYSFLLGQNRVAY